MYIYLFYTLWYNMILPLLFIFLLNCSTFGHWQFFQIDSYVPLASPHPFDFRVLLYFYTLRDVLRSPCIFLPWPDNEPLVQGVLVPFTGEQYSKPESGVLGVFDWYWGVTDFRPLSGWYDFNPVLNSLCTGSLTTVSSLLEHACGFLRVPSTGVSQQGLHYWQWRLLMIFN